MSMIDPASLPYYRSYLLQGKVVRLDEVNRLSNQELNLLNIETRAGLSDARHMYETFEDKSSEEAGQWYRRIKVANYFQAAIGLELTGD